jgi:uncharacterized membrane protein YeaQ/YmgE (transglycosylase-associated protein family)
MAENTLALLLYLSSSASPLPNLGTYTPPTTVFFALAGRFFFSYSFQTANRLYAAMLLASLALTAFTTEYKQLGVYPRAMLGVIGAFVGAILSSNAAAFLMARVFGKGMSWFSHEWLCVVLYAPPAVVGKFSDSPVPVKLAHISSQESWFHNIYSPPDSPKRLSQVSSSHLSHPYTSSW